MFNSSKNQLNKFIKFQGFQICEFFLTILVLVEFLSNCDLFSIKVAESYLGPMLVPDNRKKQMIYPHCWNIKITFNSETLCVKVLI